VYDLENMVKILGNLRKYRENPWESSEISKKADAFWRRCPEKSQSFLLLETFEI
jgi:hypothetical protein